MIHLLIPLKTEPKSYGKQPRNNNHLFWNRPQLMPRILHRLFNSQAIHPKQLPTESRGSCRRNEDLLVNGNHLPTETSGDQNCRSIFKAATEKDHRLSPLLEVAIAAQASVWKGPVEYTHAESQKVIPFATDRQPKLDWSQVMSGLMLALPLISSVILALSRYLSWRISPGGKYTTQGEQGLLGFIELDSNPNFVTYSFFIGG